MNLLLFNSNCIKFAAIIFGVIFWAALLQPVYAQQSLDLMKRLERLQNELSTLQKYVYRGNVRAALKNLNVQTKPSLNTALARLSNSITQLDAEVRRLTGTNEELNHKISQLQTRVNKIDTDVEFRLKKLESRFIPTSLSDPKLPKFPQQIINPKEVAEPPKGEVEGAERGVRLFGPKTKSSINEISVKESPKKQFDKAYSHIIKQNHDEAEKAFVEFIIAHPKHPFASNAYYWLGRTYFVREDFGQAASTFAEGFKKFPQSKKAPATLLNLGMSLSKLSKSQEACITYQRLQKNFKELKGRIKRKLDRERRLSNCRR
ncbi:MAG: tol-pal system protein YbgF [Pseudomonadota bacterium]|nr:tol-pal system protein YbgF [Pseudomonadota bacterium]